jgi:hypothetical protein
MLIHITERALIFSFIQVLQAQNSEILSVFRTKGVASTSRENLEQQTEKECDETITQGSLGRLPALK